MNPYLDIFLTKQSNNEVNKIVDYLASHREDVVLIMECFFHDNLRICQYSAHVVGKLADKDPQILYPYVDRMVKNIHNPVHDAVVRNTFRTFQIMDFPDDLIGDVYDVSFAHLEDISKPIAIRVFAMTVCAGIALKHPELQEELKYVIEEHMPYSSSGYKARAKKILQNFK